MKMFIRLELMIFFVGFCSNVYADSVTTIPKGTAFILKNELEIPANTKFVLMGKDGLQDFFTQMEQPLNQMEGRYYCTKYPFYDYYTMLTQSAMETYRKCVERHRTYHLTDNNASNGIVNIGNNNTNIIINNSTGSSSNSSSLYSTVSPNLCTKPEFTFSALVINTKKSEQGGLFRKGYRFVVKNVTVKSKTNYNVITIRLDHNIARAITIITSTAPKNIIISQLEASEKKGKGFFNSLAHSLGNMNDIAGNNFEIEFPDKKYFD